MAGKLSFLLTIDGIPKAAGDLKQLQDALKSLGGVTAGGLGNVAAGSDKASVGINKMATATARAGKEAQILKAAINSQSASFAKLNPNLAAMVAGAGAGTAPTGSARLSGISPMAASINLSAQRIMTQRANALQAGRDLDLNMRNQVAHFKAMQANGMIPTKQAIDWKMLGMGLMAAPFSPWMGARAINSSGVMNAFGAGGAGGGLFGKLMGPGGFGGFLVAFVGYQIAMKIATGIMNEFAGAVKRGANLFLTAAKLGTSTGNVSHLSSVFGALGLPPGLAEQLMAGGQFGRGNKMSVNDIMIGAGQGNLGKEQFQAIRNLSKDIAYYWTQTATAAKASAAASRALFLLSADWGVLVNNWKALWEEMATIVSSAMRVVIGITNMFLEKLIQWGAWVIWFMQTLRLLPWGDPRANQKFGGGGTQGQFNSWQRMGFVFNGSGGHQDHARVTAANTGKLVQLFEKFVTVEETTPGYDQRYNLP